MKLLILTQKIDINDDILGFFHYWTSEFAKHCEKIIVICLQKGEYNLPANVRVLSLGKEKFSHNSCLAGRRAHRFRRLALLYSFYKYIWQERKNYDAVFVHMNQQYVILGGLLWKLMNKKIGLWYAHGSAPFTLSISEKLADVIFTSTKSGFRLPSKKVNVVGQGIDTNKFEIRNSRLETNKKFKIITFGRISPVKNIEVLIEAAEILFKDGLKIQVDIIGGPGLPEQEKYLDGLKKMVKEKQIGSVINFLGPIPNKDIVSHLQSADLFANMSHTGSLDKAILEAMACGLPVLTCNEALLDVLGKYKETFMYPKKDYKKLAEKIEFILKLNYAERKKIGEDLRNIVVENHSIDGLITKILKDYDL